MVIVTNTYPHTGLSASMVEGSPWLDIRVSKAANLAIDRALTKLLGGMMMEARRRVSRPPLVRQSDSRHQVTIRRGQEAAGRRRLRAEQEAEDQDRDLDVGSGQMLPLPMNEYVQENLREVGFDVEFEVMNGTRW